MVEISVDKSSIESRLNTNSKNEVKTLESELRKANTRLAELDRLFARLYEDNVADKISERNYEAMSKRYEQEQIQLDGRIADITRQLNEARETSSSAANFVQLVKDYAGIETLTAALLNTLIDRITVSDITVVDGERVQTIKIYYKFIGCIA
jgi:TolA-binding protein